MSPGGEAPLEYIERAHEHQHAGSMLHWFPASPKPVPPVNKLHMKDMRHAVCGTHDAEDNRLQECVPGIVRSRVLTRPPP